MKKVYNYVKKLMVENEFNNLCDDSQRQEFVGFAYICSLILGLRG